MQISSGIIIINDKNQILGCKPHGKFHNYVDIPKGKIEIGETPYAAALRETKEETGLDMSKVKLIDCGEHPYLKDKRLHVFLCHYNDVIIEQLNCSTYYTNRKNNKQYPEIVSYEWIDNEDINDRFYINLAPIIQKVKR